MSSAANGSSVFPDVFKGSAGEAGKHISVNAFALNIAFGLVVFTLELTGFFILKGAAIGRRLYQPKTYLVQERLRVGPIPANPLKWIHGIFSLPSEELKAKCGLDGYFFIRFIRAMLTIFVPLMVLLLTVLVPINVHGGADNGTYSIGNRTRHYDVTGFDRLSWQNVAPSHTDRYWAHLVCALVAISWALYRIWREKLHLIEVRQQFLTSPEYRLKASARTILITNIPSEYRSGDALKAMYDIFVDNDERSRLFVWVNRDYKPLRALVKRRANLCSALEKEELRILRLINKKNRADIQAKSDTDKGVAQPPEDKPVGMELDLPPKHAHAVIADTFEADRADDEQRWQEFLKDYSPAQITIQDDGAGHMRPASMMSKVFGGAQKRQVPKIPWLRAEIARLTVQIDELLPKLDNEERFPRQNSAFIQFDRQMAAHMACSLVSHHLFGRMSPRFLDVAPHEVLWPNMGLTSLSRLIRTCIALVLFVAMLVLWGIPTTFLGILSQLETLRTTTTWLRWLQPWPSWIISFIAGPLATVLLALLVQLVVPALCRKLAVLVGAPTRSTRETITQQFYFTFLLVELVLVTSISSGLVSTIPAIISNPASITSILASDLPKAANYFFNYLIIQAFGFSGSVLFQYLRILYITLIWPCFTQTPRQEAWLQTTIPHQMWGNVYPLFTNFAVIGLIYSVTSPLILVFSSATFALFWIAYRHNYYYVQRNKVDTHGRLFNNALSQLFAGIYILEITLIGLFFVVQDEKGNLACTAQGVIMIVAVALTAAFQFVMEQLLSPLYEFLPVTLDDDAVDKEKRWLLALDKSDANGENSIDEVDPSSDDSQSACENKQSGSSAVLEESPQARSRRLVKSMSVRQKEVAATAENARQQLSRMKRDVAARFAVNQTHSLTPRTTTKSTLREAEDKLGTAIAGFPDELADLSSQERDAELKAAYQDPVTRQPAPVIWIPQDKAGVSERTVEYVKRYGPLLQYSNAGSILTEKNKCVITEPSPDIRGDWLLDWVL